MDHKKFKNPKKWASMTDEEVVYWLGEMSEGPDTFLFTEFAAKRFQAALDELWKARYWAEFYRDEYAADRETDMEGQARVRAALSLPWEREGEQASE